MSTTGGEMRNISDIQRRISGVYNFCSEKFKEIDDQKTKFILDHIFRETHTTLKYLAEIKEQIKKLIE